MKKYLVCLLMALLVVSCAKKDNGKILATIDDDKITLQEFNKELDKIPMNMKMLVASESGKKNYLDRLVVKKLLLKEASKAKIESEKEFQDRVNDIREQLLIEALLKKKISADTQMSEDDLKKYYEEHKEDFKKDREINTRHILLKTEEEAKQVQAKLQKGEDFVELAKKYSIDPNVRQSGGEIGFQPKGSLIPEFENAAYKLNKVGQVSGIVKTQFGYHIIRLEGVKPPSYVPLDEVKEFIKQKNSQEKQKEVLEKYIEELKKNAKITINEALLKDEKSEQPVKAESPDKASSPQKVETPQKQEAPSKQPEAEPSKSSVKEEPQPKK
ncbi:MAG TPA: peptidylprolyl isomerase [Syntrophorhabdus sp.]|jgi:peptidyl-prolyl cis-trans isomerase C|nr:peptidylprolyl isomerase [Syntrophorhabdus sp.]HNY71376.1 peptidylprolyl isomerase [Syntrophorhabdus sp.]HOH27632.1 peptidylprolyl isomerase [Syntrophorhabdus sp.]